MPMDVIYMSEVLQKHWIDNSLERHASHCFLRAMASQLELTTGASLDSYLVPSFVSYKRLLPEERRMQTSTGEFVVCNIETGDVRVQLPLTALSHNYYIFASLTDRSGIIASALYYLMNHGFLLTARWGWFHGLWNGIKKAAMQAKKSKVWDCILGFLVVCNINDFPFRSSQAFDDKKAALKAYLATHTHASGSFQAIKHDFAKGLGRVLHSEEDEARLFEELGSMPSFNRKGMLCKLMRWISIQECWLALSGELAGAKLIYGEMCRDASAPSLVELLGTAASINAAPANAKKKESGNQYRRAFNWICPHNCFLMDMFTACTGSLHSLYSLRSSCYKSIDKGFEWNLSLAKGGFFGELVGVAKASFYDEVALRRLGVHQDRPEAAPHIAALLDFAFNLLHFRVEATLPEIEGYPYSSIKALDPDVTESQAARRLMLRDWHILLEVERLAYSHDVLDSILKTVVWRDHALVRLLLMVNELEQSSQDAKGTTYILDAIHRVLPDDKGAEDIHQHIRDEGRRQRRAIVGPLRVMRSSLESGVPESRELDAVSVSVDELSKVTRYDATQKAARHRFYAAPKRWPSDVDNIANNHREWSSPTAATSLQSVAAWSWLAQWFGESHWRRSGTTLAAAWRAKLLRPKELLFSGRQCWLVVSVCTWAVYLWRCELLRDGIYKLDMDSPEKAHWRFVVNVKEYSTALVRGLFEPTQGLVFEAVDHLPMLGRALLARIDLSLAELEELHKELDTAAWSPASKKADAYEALAKFVLSPWPGRIDEFLAPSAIDDDDDDASKRAASLSELWEEVVMHDADNAAEVKGAKEVMVRRAEQSLRKAASTAKGRAGNGAKGRSRKKGAAVAKRGARAVRKRRCIKIRHGGLAPAGATDDVAGPADPPPLPPPTSPPRAHDGTLGCDGDGPGGSIVGEAMPEGGGAHESLNVPRAGEPAAATPELAGALEVDERGALPLDAGDHGEALETQALDSQRPAPVKLYSTPELLKLLCPPECTLSIDVPACRWRARVAGAPLPSVGFGPWSGRDRRSALVETLDALWAHVPGERPATSYIDSIPREQWGSFWDVREERPRKYPKK